MTTYLAILSRRSYFGQSETRPYCSSDCRRYDSVGWTIEDWRDDDSYEFDEVCGNCGVVVPASHPDSGFMRGAEIARAVFAERDARIGGSQ